MRSMPRVYLLLATVAPLACATPRTSWRPPALVGKTVQVSATSLDGREVKLPAPGVRATVVDFWATWCEPCRDQLPELDRLGAEWRDRGVQVYAISFDEDRAAVEEFVARTPVGIPVLWDKGGGTLAERLELTRLPTTVLLDADGVVRAVHLGYDRDQAAALAADLRHLVGR